MSNLARDRNARSSGVAWQKRDKVDRIAGGDPIDDATLCEISLLYVQPPSRRLLKMALKEVGFLEEEMQQLDQELAGLLRKHEDAVKRLAEVPGLGVDSAQQILAEVGAEAEAFASAKKLAAWVGVSMRGRWL
jgi:transposase